MLVRLYPVIMQLFSDGAWSQQIDHVSLVLNVSRPYGFMNYPESMNLKQLGPWGCWQGQTNLT